MVAAAPAWAQATPPVSHIAVEKHAIVFLDSIANQSRAQHKEVAACVTRYAVDRDTLLIGELEPSTHVVDADSIAIWADGQMLCSPGVPTLHTHLIIPGFLAGVPSPTDFKSSARAGVWALILVVTDVDWRIIVY